MTEVANACQKRSVEVSRKVEQAMTQCEKQGVTQLNELVRDLTQLKEFEKETTSKLRAREFVYRESWKPLWIIAELRPELNGVIAHLTREYGGNVNNTGVAAVIMSSFDQDSNVVADLGTHQSARLRGENSWICYNFKERCVIPTSYSVMSGAYDHLKSWVVEVSNDGRSWTEIDRRDNDNDLNGRHATANFKISKVPSESFRFFRLRQTDKGTVEVAALEIFGNVFVNPRPSEHQFVFYCQADRGGQVPPLFPPKLDGVIAHLTRECGGNVHDKGIVNVTATTAVVINRRMR